MSGLRDGKFVTICWGLKLETSWTWGTTTDAETDLRLKFELHEMIYDKKWRG